VSDSAQSGEVIVTTNPEESVREIVISDTDKQTSY